ncbi:MAG: hypothetical protein QXI09_03260 [Candidatus Aenigmatarchaeota archaeon]
MRISQYEKFLYEEKANDIIEDLKKKGIEATVEKDSKGASYLKIELPYCIEEDDFLYNNIYNRAIEAGYGGGIEVDFRIRNLEILKRRKESKIGKMDEYLILETTVSYNNARTSPLMSISTYKNINNSGKEKTIVEIPFLNINNPLVQKILEFLINYPSNIEAYRRKKETIFEEYQKSTSF